ncbi:UDP-glucose/GDP-mannose dehydrogenase family protein [Galbitalea sp. SE-J8]|uniref:UDP-glucose dehydrogenase family protein n=1 Tax=Galbitalea sp. SE-J8 TaxID=3054952 RepID=UPI00259CBF37|nr:UDP-glucose/GDP-mannose dehydrogenase family protein [Galbitalea sp. SE-J8]MDM4763961.1 UDP-glucose/GDP-mannose dehydrogenase family protein [Galbitalea sp. SE-J8]
MRISVTGCGYLGAVHAVSMAELGHDVVGIDVDPLKVSALSAGVAPFFEPGLEELLASALATGRLRFSTDAADARGAQVHFIAVGTPQRADSNAADLRFVDAAIDSLLPHLSPGDLVAGKSTVPVGTAARLAERVASSGSGALLAWNPEFLREGYAVQDTISPDRLVYGLPSDGSARAASEALLDEVYATALAAGTPKVVADHATAELVKTAANAFLATKISFINAMAEIAETVDADVTLLADAIGHDARIGRRFLNAGIGFGGGCLPKDIRAFQARADELGRGDALSFLREIDTINLRRRDRVCQMVVEELGGQVYRKKVAVLGLAFKPDSDDIRDSPALDVAVRLLGLGAHVIATDPEAIPNSIRKHPQLGFATDTADALHHADAIVLVTEWQEYRDLDPAVVAGLASGRVVVDGRNVLDPERWAAAGFTYRGMGRPRRAPAPAPVVELAEV